VMIADPPLIPVTVVTTRGAIVTPCGMKKVDGDTVALVGSLLTNVMYTPPAGAAVPSVTGKFTVAPGVTATLAGNRMPPAAGCVTVTLAVALAMFDALAVIVTDPAATPVTGTDTVVAPAPKLTVEGAVATLTLLELRLTTSPAVVGADRFSVRFCVVAWLIVRLPGQKLIVVLVGITPPVTCTWALAVG
jgi:hypothetical protein